ncbi:MAG: ShlB/FhaC/HecB family hemolysin secretion/activation protein [Deltaproteobacteria bacterium]|nr:ShlB/FhaC/HecB family hemolysin secretion/activation protein [Deltaproteobacteria bacterium]
MKIPGAWVLTLLLALPALPVLPGVAGAAAGGETLGRFSEQQGPVYLVGRLSLEYASEHALQPSLDDVRAADYALGLAYDGYVGPRRGAQNEWFTLHELGRDAPARVYASGLRELNQQIVRQLNLRGLIGVYVAPHEDDIDSESGHDLREPGYTSLRLVVYAGRVEGLRTFGSGYRLSLDERLDDARHDPIREQSPVQPAGVDGRAEGDLLLRDEIDDYVTYLNRHPGRRVDLNLTPSRAPGGVYLDYLVAEERPWSAYAQISDTGTDATTDWRQRFGFLHNQLTGNDDILRLDYVTGNFDDVNAGFGSYELPVAGVSERSRMRFSGSWSEYHASTFGSDDDFEGRTWDAGGELITNVYQERDFFLDLIVGARWLWVESEQLSDFSGDENFLLPGVGFRFDRLRNTSMLWGYAKVEHNLSSLAGTSDDEDDLFLLGRSEIDEDFTLMKWSGGFSFYLEPWLRPRAWANPRSPSSSTLAHEIAFTSNGQYAFGTRVIPQIEQAVGGLYSVRGYEQAVIPGDNVAQATLEYRYHWPRTFPIEPAPRRLAVVGDFRVAPQRVYGRPDWDLVLRAFFDSARVWYSDSQPGEESETLASLGFGIELLVLRNLQVRWDFGWALRDVREVEKGDTEAHFTATVRY